MVRAQQNLTIREYRHNDVFFWWIYPCSILLVDITQLHRLSQDVLLLVFALDPLESLFTFNIQQGLELENFVLTHRRRCAQHMTRPVYTVAFVKQLTALLAIWWALFLKISQLCSRRFMVRGEQNPTIREYRHNDVFFDEYILSKFYLLISLSYVDYLKMFYF